MKSKLALEVERIEAEFASEAADGVDLRGAIAHADVVEALRVRGLPVTEQNYADELDRQYGAVGWAATQEELTPASPGEPLLRRDPDAAVHSAALAIARARRLIANTDTGVLDQDTYDAVVQEARQRLGQRWPS
jgi:hypothetical protein